MDVLSDVLQIVRLSGAVFFTAEFSSPWALESPSHDLLTSIVMPEAEYVSLFHILMEGECIVECAAHPATSMQGGDVIVFPHGEPHTMRSHDGAASTPLDHVFSQGARDELPRVALGGGGAKALFLCGYLNWDQWFGPFHGALPTMLLVRSHDQCRGVDAIGRSGRRPLQVPHEAGTWLGNTLNFTINEAMAARPGNAAMLSRLAELIFVDIVREYMQQLPEGERGWLAGLKDPSVGRALRLLHGRPMHNWTVERLAREVAVSRSALAQRFTGLIGVPPMKYLSLWRIQLAKQMLRDREATVETVAGRVGYDSEPAFNRAFKRATGHPPGMWRKVALRRLAVPADFDQLSS